MNRLTLGLPGVALNIALAAGLVAGAQTVAAEGAGLLQVYDLAVENDAEIRAARYSLDAAREFKPIARSGLLPQVAASGSANERRQEFESGNSDNFADSDISVNLSQPLFRRDRWIQFKQADNVVGQAEKELEAEEQSLILRVAATYFAVLGARDTLRFAKAERKALDRQLDQSQQRYDVGLIAITDVLEVKSERDNAVASEIEAQNRLDDAYEALAEIIGTSPGELARLSPDFKLEYPNPRDEAAWTERGIVNNPGLEAVREATEVARQEVEVQRSGHYPTVDLVGGYSWLDSDSAFSNFSLEESGSIGVQLNVPIYTGGRISSTTRQARANFASAQESLEGQRRFVVRRVGDAYRGVTSSVSRVNALKATVASTKSALDATSAGYDVGTRTLVDVLLFQRSYYSAEADYALARYGYILNKFALEEAVGTLDEDDVREINAWLN
ncbi:MAG: TolC family outer membrane protein [Pseudomonadota bacterium]